MRKTNYFSTRIFQRLKGSAMVCHISGTSKWKKVKIRQFHLKQLTDLRAIN